MKMLEKSGFGLQKEISDGVAYLKATFKD